MDHSWRFKYHLFCSVTHLSVKAIVCLCVCMYVYIHTQPFISSEKPTLKNTGSAFILFLIRNLKNLKSCLTGPDIPTVCTGFPMNPWGALASPSQRSSPSLRATKRLTLHGAGWLLCQGWQLSSLWTWIGSRSWGTGIPN